MNYRRLVFAAIAASLAISARAALPDGYCQLTSITSTGTQYIQTGMKPTATTTVEMDFNTGPYVGDTTFFRNRRLDHMAWKHLQRDAMGRTVRQREERL